MSRLLNLELNDINETESNKQCVIEQNLTSSLFSDDISRELAITRFKIPINLMELMNINIVNDPEFLIQFESDILKELEIETFTNTGTTYLMPTSINPIFSPGDFIEYVNRGFARAHRNVITNFISFIKSVTANDLIFNTLGSPVTERNLNISASGTTECYYVKLILDNYRVNSAPPNEIGLVNISLASPGGVVCRIASSVLLEAGKQYVFENGGVLSYSAAKKSDNKLNTTYPIVPMETFLKFKDEAIHGNWKLIITTPGFGSIDITINAQLEVCTPATNANFRYPNQPPIVEFDEKGFIEWHIPERFLHGDFRIKLGARLKTVLSYYKTVPADGYMKFPILAFSSGINGIASFVQESARLYNIVSCERIQISLAGINLDRDLNNNRNPSNAITSFLLPSDEVIHFTEITYNTDASVRPYRRYRLHNSANLNNFKLSVEVIYRDGSRKDLYIEPHSSWNLMLSFFEVDRL